MILAHQPKLPDLTAAISSAADGSMRFPGIEPMAAVRMEAWLPSIGVDPAQTVGLRIVYGDDRTYDVIKYIDSPVGGGVLQENGWVEADVLITDQPSVALLLPIGDCYPIILHDAQAKVLALAHLGWQSTDVDMAKRTVEYMVDKYGVSPDNIQVYIGPGIKKESYRFADFAQLTDTRWKDHLHHGDETVGIDLLGYNMAGLLSAGVTANHIQVIDVDTATDERYFSNYGTKRLHKPLPDGRFVTVAMMNPFD